MFNLIDGLHASMMRTAKDLASRGEPHLIKGGFEIAYRPDNQMYSGVVYSETFEDWIDDDTTHSDLEIQFDCDKKSWKKAYRILRLNFGKQMNEIEKDLTRIRNRSSLQRLISIRSAVARMELLAVCKRQEELEQTLQYLDEYSFQLEGEAHV